MRRNISENTKRRIIQANSCGQRRPDNLCSRFQHSMRAIYYRPEISGGSCPVEGEAERELIFFSREQDEKMCVCGGQWRKVE